tara:strand:- start:1202 stop:1381 length:180 start_codon:yes stop_codon:yes gene_type:complete
MVRVNGLFDYFKYLENESMAENSVKRRVGSRLELYNFDTRALFFWFLLIAVVLSKLTTF